MEMTLSLALPLFSLTGILGILGYVLVYYNTRKKRTLVHFDLGVYQQIPTLTVADKVKTRCVNAFKMSTGNDELNIVPPKDGGSEHVLTKWDLKSPRPFHQWQKELIDRSNEIGKRDFLLTFAGPCSLAGLAGRVFGRYTIVYPTILHKPILKSDDYQLYEFKNYKGTDKTWLKSEKVYINDTIIKRRNNAVHLYVTHANYLYPFTDEKKKWVAEFLEKEGYQYVATLVIMPIKDQLEVCPENILNLQQEVESFLGDFRYENPNIDTVVFDSTGPTPFAFAIGQCLVRGRFMNFFGIEMPNGEGEKAIGSPYIRSF